MMDTCIVGEKRDMCSQRAKPGTQDDCNLTGRNRSTRSAAENKVEYHLAVAVIISYPGHLLLSRCKPKDEHLNKCRGENIHKR
jgi:hypothetical protein